MADTQTQPFHLMRAARNPEIPIGALRAIAQLKRQLTAWESDAIASARAKGATWSDIAEALGVTRQALQQRLARAAGDGASSKRA